MNPRWLAGWSRDLGESVRALGRRPGLVVAAILSLALGIGANTAIFSAMSDLFLDPVPVEAPEELVNVYTRVEGLDAYLPVSKPNFEDLRRSLDSLSRLVAVRVVLVALTGEAEPELVLGEMVSSDYFEVLGIEPALGRLLHAEDGRQGAAVAVLSDGLFRGRFGADPAVVGRTVQINGIPFEVVGVAPPGFRGLRRLADPQLWVPLEPHDALLPRVARRYLEVRRATLLGLVGRLTPGMGVGEARAELAARGEELARRYPDDNGGRTFTLLPVTETGISPNSRGEYLSSNLMLLVMSGLVLLVAVANVANLLIVRALDRRREVSVRLALGASRGLLVRRFLVESLVLAAVAGLCGVVLGAWLADLLPRMGLPYLPPELDPELDLRVLGYALGLTLLTGLLFGLAPALRAGREDVVPALKAERGSGREHPRGFGLRNLLVAIQVALSLVAVIGAALFGASLAHARGIDPGFTVDELLLVSFDLESRGYDEARGLTWMNRAVTEVEALPGVESAAIGQELMLVNVGLRRTMTAVGGDPAEELIVQTNAVGPGYFETLEIPVVAGRPIDATDRADSRPVVVINRTFAQRRWPDQDPVGRQLRLSPTGEVRDIVGVVEDVDYNDLGEEPQLYAYLPLAQSYAGSVTLHMRTGLDPASLVEPVRRTLQGLDRDLALVDLEPMAAVLGDVLAEQRAAAWLLAALSVLGVVLAVIGIYGVLAYSVAQRRREIGLRMALGAERRDVIGLFVRRTTRTVLAGVGVGLVVAGFGSTLVARLLFGTDGRDPVLYLLAAVAVTAVSVVAALLSARRAARIPPIVAMRQE